MFNEVLTACNEIQEKLIAEAKFGIGVKDAHNYTACNFQIKKINELFSQGGVEALYNAGYSSSGKSPEIGACISIVGKIKSLEMAITGFYYSQYSNELIEKFNLK